MSRPRRSRAARKLVAVGATGILGLTGAVAGAATAHAADTVAVPTGATAQSLAATGATVFGTTDPATAETVTFVLRMRGMEALGAAVQLGVQPNLSVQQFATHFGQSPRDIKRLTDYLKGFGISTTVYANNLNVTASGTAGAFNKALSITQQNLSVPAQPTRHGHRGLGSQRVHAPTHTPLLPRDLGGMVTAILGLSNYAPFTSQAVQVDPQLKSTSDASTSSTCPVANARPSGCNLPSDYASRYGMSPLYKAGFNGAGQTLGIVTLAAYDEGAAETFWTQYEHLPTTGRTVTVQDIDGGPGAPNDEAGTGETDLDVEQSGGVAPGANVVVYQAPNTDSGWIDAFFTAAAQNVAGSVSSSWGSSETTVRAAIASGQEDPAYQRAYDEAFLEMAAQGQSTFLSSGDEGAYTASADIKTTDVSSDTPANSAYVTSAGGTTTPWTGSLHSTDGTITAPISVAKERAWGWDYAWQPIATVRKADEGDIAKKEIVGGGGGYSTMENRPLYQLGVSGVDRYSAVQYLTPTNYQKVNGLTLPTDWSFNANPSVTTGRGSGRVQPDVSADADPFTGYLLWEPSGPSAKLQAGWGGTSYVAPQFNGSAAVMNQALGRRVGLWNPALYRLAKGHNSPVTPLNDSGTSNDNLFFTGTPGTLYNPAVGLGTPNFAVFTRDLARR